METGLTAEEDRPTDRSNLLLMRVWALLAHIEGSLRSTFRQESAFSQLQRNLIIMIGNFGNVTSTELVVLSGREKAQISHALAALTELELVERSSLRAPVTLSPTGKAQFEHLMAMAERGDDALTRGIPRTAIAAFLTTVQRLMDRSATVLVNERELALGAGIGGNWANRPQLKTYPERLRTSGPDRPLALMVTPRLQALFAYLERGAALTYRRTMGFSLFETIVISHLGDRKEMALGDLIDLTNRDKGQVGRTIRRLETLGLLGRAATSNRRRIVLCLTPAGREIAARMMAIAQDRDQTLIEGIPQAELDEFGVTLARITANASAVVAERRGE